MRNPAGERDAPGQLAAFAAREDGFAAQGRAQIIDPQVERDERRNLPTAAQTAMPLAVSIRLTIAPDARMPLSGTPTSSSRHGRPSSAQFSPALRKFHAERAPVPDAAGELEESGGIEAVASERLAGRGSGRSCGKALGGFAHQRDHVGNALRAVGAELARQVERRERGGDVHPAPLRGPACPQPRSAPARRCPW